MKSEVEKYQERLAELNSILENTLNKNEHFFTDDDACGDEVFTLFKKIAEITDGHLKYKNGDIIEIDTREFNVSITYELIILNESINLNYICKLSKVNNTSEICNELNNLLKAKGYKGENYFFDICQDVGSSGFAFSNFGKELKLFENGVIWRGRSEFENSEGYGYFWSNLKDYNNLKSNQSNYKQKTIESELIYTQQKDTGIEKLIRFPPSKVKNPWWKFWKK